MMKDTSASRGADTAVRSSEVPKMGITGPVRTLGLSVRPQPPRAGLLVTSVQPSSWAEDEGFGVGDEIFEVNGKSVRDLSVEDFSNGLQTMNGAYVPSLVGDDFLDELKSILKARPLQLRSSSPTRAPIDYANIRRSRKYATSSSTPPTVGADLPQSAAAARTNAETCLAEPAVGTEQTPDPSHARLWPKPAKRDDKSLQKDEDTSPPKSSLVKLPPEIGPNEMHPQQQTLGDLVDQADENQSEDVIIAEFEAFLLSPDAASTPAKREDWLLPKSGPITSEEFEAFLLPPNAVANTFAGPDDRMSSNVEILVRPFDDQALLRTVEPSSDYRVDIEGVSDRVRVQEGGHLACKIKAGERARAELTESSQLAPAPRMRAFAGDSLRQMDGAQELLRTRPSAPCHGSPVTEKVFRGDFISAMEALNLPNPSEYRNILEGVARLQPIQHSLIEHQNAEDTRKRCEAHMKKVKSQQATPQGRAFHYQLQSRAAGWQVERVHARSELAAAQLASETSWLEDLKDWKTQLLASPTPARASSPLHLTPPPDRGQAHNWIAAAAAVYEAAGISRPQRSCTPPPAPPQQYAGPNFDDIMSTSRNWQQRFLDGAARQRQEQFVPQESSIGKNAGTAEAIAELRRRAHGLARGEDVPWNVQPPAKDRYDPWMAIAETTASLDDWRGASKSIGTSDEPAWAKSITQHLRSAEKIYWGLPSTHGIPTYPQLERR